MDVGNDRKKPSITTKILTSPFSQVPNAQNLVAILASCNSHPFQPIVQFRKSPFKIVCKSIHIFLSPCHPPNSSCHCFLAYLSLHILTTLLHCLRASLRNNSHSLLFFNLPSEIFSASLSLLVNQGPLQSGPNHLFQFLSLFSSFFSLSH